MDIKELSKLVNLMKRYNLQELEIEEPDRKVRLKSGLRAEVIQPGCRYFPTHAQAQLPRFP